MLTDAQCRAAKPREGIYRLNDYKGLYLEVKPNGVKAWRYRFKLNGKASWYALGDYPNTTLGEAREKALARDAEDARQHREQRHDGGREDERLPAVAIALRDRHQNQRRRSMPL